MGFGRGNLARRQDLQGIGARQLGPFATVQVWARAHGAMAEYPDKDRITECRQAGLATDARIRRPPGAFTAVERRLPMYREREVCIPLIRQTRSFWIGPRSWWAKGWPHRQLGGMLSCTRSPDALPYALTLRVQCVDRRLSHGRIMRPMRFSEGYLWCW